MRYPGIAVCVAAFGLLTAPSGELRAQERSAATIQTAVVAPRSTYEAGWLHRFLLGDLNRDLWSLPVEAPVLDLDTYAGGLTATERGGGLQTTSLRFQTEDGRRYTFRSIDKDATRNLDPFLQQTIAARLLQDQIGALFPLSAMVVAPLLDAADVLHASPDLVVMPQSHPLLGEFEEEFGGLLGWIEVRPDEGPDGEPGFAGATRVTGSKAFLRRLEDSPKNDLDARSFLRARLMDLLVGDWDRHPDQWRWAAFEAGEVTRWEPIPRDRDWALSHIDGFLIGLGRGTWPHYVGFSDSYESVFGTTWNGRALDRRLLSGLTRSDWEEIAQDLQGRLTDEVIDGAVAKLPTAYLDEVGEELRSGLHRRRDRLPTAAMEYYSILSGWVDIQATDHDELALVERSVDGTVRVRIFDGRSAEPRQATAYFDRSFIPAETREVRLHLHGGDDRVEVTGPSSGSIRVRVVGGGGDDVFLDQTSGQNVDFYDDRGTNTVEAGSASEVDRSEYEEPIDTESATHQARPRDWGARWSKFPILGFNSDIGPFIGQTRTRESYGFRKFPWSTRLTLAYSVLPLELGVAGGGRYEVRLGGSDVLWASSIEGSTREVGYFFGVGNETVRNGATTFFRADRGTIDLFTGIAWTPTPKTKLEAGPILGFSTPVHEGGEFIEPVAPYGFDDFVRMGLHGSLIVDTRDNPGLPEHGGVLRLTGRYLAEVGDVESAYGGVAGSLSHNLHLGWPTVSVRVGGEKVWGRFPFFDGANLGGLESLRGFTDDRFLGDASVFGSAQIRLPISDFKSFLPGTFGIHGLYDIGRVFVEDDVGLDDWHDAWGGGFWMSLIKSDYTISATAVDSDEGTRAYVSLGFIY